MTDQASPANVADRPRPARALPALRRGAFVSGLPDAASGLRALRARLQLRRRRRRPGGVRHSDRRRHRRVRRADHRSASISRRTGCTRLLWLPLILIVTLAPLRLIKGLLIALQYHHKARKAASSDGVTREDGARQAPRDVLDATMFALAGVAILVGLGIWQLDRKVWKENLIATLNVAAWRRSGRSAAARQLAVAERERRRISPRHISCRVSRRRRGTGLHRRLRLAS